MGRRTEQGGLYQIEVQGALDERWSDRLGGLSIEVLSGTGDLKRVRVEGWVQDQAALAGIFEALMGLRVSLVSVRLLGDEEPAPAAPLLRTV